jgi:hypothetical protein
MSGEDFYVLYILYLQQPTWSLMSYVYWLFCCTGTIVSENTVSWWFHFAFMIQGRLRVPNLVPYDKFRPSNMEKAWEHLNHIARISHEWLKYRDKKSLKGKSIFNKLARKDVLMGLVPAITMEPDLRNTYSMIGICTATVTAATVIAATGLVPATTTEPDLCNTYSIIGICAATVTAATVIATTIVAVVAAFAAAVAVATAAVITAKAAIATTTIATAAVVTATAAVATAAIAASAVIIKTASVSTATIATAAVVTTRAAVATAAVATATFVTTTATATILSTLTTRLEDTRHCKERLCVVGLKLG